jgi:hypothetical protein
MHCLRVLPIAVACSLKVAEAFGQDGDVGKYNDCYEAVGSSFLSCVYVCVRACVRALDQKFNAQLRHMLTGTNGKSKSNTSMLH